MSKTLSELEDVLLYKHVKLTPQDVNLLPKCRSKLERDMKVGAAVGVGFGWAATTFLKVIPIYKAIPRLGYPIRVGTSIVGGCFFAVFTEALSSYSCYDYLLSLEGSSIQKELAHLLVRKYGDNPLVSRFLSKRFYSERVFDDLSLDQPKIRWRYWNFFSDNVVNGQRIQERNSLSSYHGDSLIDYHSDYSSISQSESSDTHIRTCNNSNKRRISLEPKQLMNSGIDIMVDPLDCVFGCPATKEEIHHPNTSSSSSRMHAQNHKRSHRRRRRCHHDDSLDFEDERH